MPILRQEILPGYTNLLVFPNTRLPGLEMKISQHRFITMNNFSSPLFSLVTSFIFFISTPAYAQPVFAGTLVCGKCGHIEKNRPAMLSHTCSRHGLNCPSGPVYSPPVATKSKQQILEEAEKKDRQEAAEDANDHGVDCYERKDWATAINYFKAALELVPDLEDALYNLKKAENKLETERQRIIKEAEEMQNRAPVQDIQTITLPPSLSRYMEEADKIIVPPPSWESMLEEKVEQVRLGQNGENNLVLTNNILVAVFDQVATTSGLDFKVKLLLIMAKATNTAQDEAEIVAFRETAWYERTLQALKDKKQGPLLISAIKALREKKPMPAGVTPEILKMAKATQDPSLGNSSIHMAMSTMLSKESRAAFFQTFKMEAISMLSDKIKDMAGKYVEDRISALKMVNERISTGKELMASFAKGIELADKSQAPLFNSMIQNTMDRLQKNIQPVKPIYETIIEVMSFFTSDRSVGN